MPADPTPIYVIWIITLALVYLVLLPLITLFLVRAALAARRIEAYAAEVLQSARGVLGNIKAATALKETAELTAALLAQLEEMSRVAVEEPRTVRTEAED